MTTIGFLLAPEPSAEATQLFDDDIAELGFVMNASRLWAYQPGTVNRLFELMKVALSGAGLSLRERGILVTACASTFGDSYCSLAWGSKLAKWADAETAAAVLSGGDGPLSDPERALADWARKVARHPNGIAPADVQALRDAGFQELSDLRAHDLRGPQDRLLHRQRRTRRTTGRAVPRHRPRRGARRRHLGPPHRGAGGAGRG